MTVATICVGPSVDVWVAASYGPGVGVRVAVGVGVSVAVGVAVAVTVLVAVFVRLGVALSSMATVVDKAPLNDTNCEDCLNSKAETPTSIKSPARAKQMLTTRPLENLCQCTGDTCMVGTDGRGNAGSAGFVLATWADRTCGSGITTSDTSLHKLADPSRHARTRTW